MRRLLEGSASEAYLLKWISSKRQCLKAKATGNLAQLSRQGLIPAIGLNKGDRTVEEPADVVVSK